MNSRKLLALALGFTVAMSAYAATSTAPAKKDPASLNQENADAKSSSTSSTGKTSGKPTETPSKKPDKNPPAAK